MSPIRRVSAICALAAAAACLLVVAGAWACVPGGETGTLEISPPQARAGEQVKVSGTAGTKSPVSIHLANGALLAEVPVAPGADGHGFQFATTVTMPADTPLGTTSLVASQDNLKWGAAFTVLARPTVVVGDPTSTGAGADSTGSASIPLIAIIVAALLLLATIGTVRAGRRRRAPVKETQTEVLVGSR